MSNKLNDEELNKVAGGQGEYSSLINDINNVKNSLKNIGGDIQSNSDYNYAIMYLESCTIDLSYGNIGSARTKLTKAVSKLRILSYNFPDLQSTFDNYVNQLTNVVTKM